MRKKRFFNIDKRPPDKLELLPLANLSASLIRLPNMLEAFCFASLSAGLKFASKPIWYLYPTPPTQASGLIRKY